MTETYFKKMIYQNLFNYEQNTENIFFLIKLVTQHTTNITVNLAS